MGDRLRGKIALVTGGGAGIGLACARRFKEEGAEVVISDLSPAVASVAAEHGFGFIEQDVASEDGWARVADHVAKAYGRLDVLVNNAAFIGSTEFGDPETASLAEFRRVFAVNVEGVFLGCRAAIDLMRTPGPRSGEGSIVNISSVGAFGPTPFLTAYGASKATVLHLTKTVAQHCAQSGLKVRCNAVAPGVVHTETWEKAVQERAGALNVSFDEAASYWRNRVPLGSLQTPDDLAAAVLFLASDEARNITGSRIIVDGGMTFA